MKEKIMAALMASIMVVVALAAFVAPAQAAGPEGASDNPKYIIGGTSDIYELGVNQTVEAKIDFNHSAYDSLTTPAFKVSTSTISETTVSGETTVGNVKITISGSNGIYTVTVKGVATDTAAVTYKINMAVKDTVWTGDNARSVDLDYNYAMNIKVVTAASAELILTDGTNNITGATAQDNPLNIQLGKDFSGWSANVSYNNTKYNYTKYDFYTTGLPAGIYLKSTGDIAGKVISTTTVTTSAQPFKVFAVDIATGEKLFAGTFYYTISLASDSFEYEIDDGNDENEHVYVPYTTPGYTAIKNYDDKKIKVNVVSGTKVVDDVVVPKEADLTDTTKYKVSYTLSDSSGAKVIDVTGDNLQDGYFTLPDNTFDGYTGVVEITIQDIVNGYKAIIHTMVVGPLVHSGLAPAVTSA